METQHPSNPFAESGLFQSSADVWRPLKVAADGGPGDGKTFAITEIARGIWEAEGKKGIVVLQDTEGSTKDIIPYFEQVGLIEDVNFFSSVSRSLLDTEKILRMCIERRAIFMIDSVTHIAEAYQDAFSREKGRPIIYPQDALILKPEWKRRFSKPLVDAECHVLFTGRAAWEYRMEINEQTGKKEFNPTKLKMRGDPELLYEPDVVLFAEQTQLVNEDGDLKPSHWLTVLKDRTRQMQGAQFKFDPTVKWSPDKNPIWDSVKPIFDFYSRGKNKTRMPAPPETSMVSLFQKGNAEAYYERRRQVDALMEEIDGVYAQWIPGSGGKEKQLRSMIWNLVFNTRSKAVLAERTPDELKRGLSQVESLSIYVAKNLDLLEKLHSDGEYEKIQAFISQELERLNKPKADDDYIPEWEQKPPPSVKEIVEAYEAAKTFDDIERIDKQVESLQLEATDRQMVTMAGDLARSILEAAAAQPKNGGVKPAGKTNRGKRSSRPSA